MKLCYVRYYFVLAAVVFSFGVLNSQEIFERYSEPNVKTSRVYIEGNELSYPLVELGGDLNLMFEFDILSAESGAYQYEIIHCDNNWKRSEVHREEYSEGFEYHDIESYDYSRNTLVPYVHYSVAIPNEEVKLKLSGNYAIRVFESSAPENTVVIEQFSLFEDIVGIRGEVIRPLGAGNQDFAQELRFSIIHEDFEINDPFSQIEIDISQNNRPDQVLKGMKPVFVRNNELVYGNAGDHIIQAGNEFRTFSLRDFKSYNLGVNAVKHMDSMYFVQLRLDERRSSKRYFTQDDINGKYTVYVDNEWEHQLSADYANVFFELLMPEPFIEGKVYVLGKFNNWKISDENQMIYNFDTKIYEKQFLLKQGYYDYYYAYVSNYDKKLDLQKIEGSHYQTENDYLVKVFYKGFGEQYYRLIGYRVLNSSIK